MVLYCKCEKDSQEILLMLTRYKSVKGSPELCQENPSPRTSSYLGQPYISHSTAWVSLVMEFWNDTLQFRASHTSLSLDSSNEAEVSFILVIALPQRHDHIRSLYSYYFVTLLFTAPSTLNFPGFYSLN